ncbi:MAG: UvrD-helicase domain-containing protein [Candidatus Omnitrophica bacterium]|nr:UvrD-helicase domain-containing protein [Candidatus Omnitrophota bacterium]
MDTKSFSPQIYIVEASAGSGKTYELAKRYIQLLLNSNTPQPPIKNILAITFTNKAALEMKERILDFLKKIALDKLQDKGIWEVLPQDKELVRKRAYLCMDEIIKNYNFFQVQTIDSFINSVISGCAFMLGLSSTLKIRQDSSDYLAYGLDNLIDQANADNKIAHLFENFLRQYIYIENKSGWLPKRDILSVITSLFFEFNIHLGSFSKYPVPSSELIVKKKIILKILKELFKHLPEGTHKGFSKKLKSFLDENEESFDIDKLSGFLKDKDFPLNKGYILPKDTEKLWKDVRREIKELCELELYSLFNCYIDIFNEVFLNFRHLAKKEDVLFLEELNKQAQVLFGENQLTVPELYYRLSLRLKHFLIDEFQDTSILQWINLYPMIEEALSVGGSLFYVGDKKQAIFRFRGGEVTLFEQVKEDLKKFGVLSSYLTNNFRSQKEIVEFNNQVFSPQNLIRFIQGSHLSKDEFSIKDLEDITNVFCDTKQTFKPENTAGFVKVEFIDVEDKEEKEKIIKEKLISLIEDLKARFGYKNIAILTRKNEEVALLTTWLIEKDIPVESEKTLNIRENPLVKEFISFLKFLNSPIDNLSFSSFILGEIFIKASGLKRQEIEDFLFQLKLISQKQDIAYYYREFRSKFPRVWSSLMEDFFRRVGFAPLYELVINIYERFQIFKNFAEAHGFFMRLLELIRENEEEHPTIASFLEYFEQAAEDDLYVNVTKSDAVKILTIHKAKGLGFGAVIIPFLEIEVKVGSGNRRVHNYVIKTEDINGENKIKLLRLKKTYSKFSDTAKKIYREEYKKAFLDELDNIYVALTRAEYELYVFIPKKAGLSFNLARFLIKEELERGKKIKYPEERQEEAPLLEISPPHYKDWSLCLKDEFREKSAIIGLEKIQQGEIIHCLLAGIDNLNKQDVRSAVKKAIEKTKFRFPYVCDFSQIEKTVKKLLDKDIFKRFFYAKGEVYVEKEIIDRCGNTKRIDRLVINDNEVWVVDYKSAKDNYSDYQRQIKEYIYQIKELYPKHEVRGFLIYLDDLSLKEVYG